jgi:hypothetical protein
MNEEYGEPVITNMTLQIYEPHAVFPHWWQIRGRRFLKRRNKFLRDWVATNLLPTSEKV